MPDRVQFEPGELDALDAAFRRAPPDAPWLGWASAGERPFEILILRRRADLRRLRLVKRGGGYTLLDENGETLWQGDTLATFVSEAALRPTPFRE
jgi:hypothetical protein